MRAIAIVFGGPRGEVRCQFQATLLQASLKLGQRKVHYPRARA
jgi:hypothetical protein